MPDEQPAAPPADDKTFADFLGQLVEGKAKDVSAEVQFFADKLVSHRDQHQNVVKAIQQAESQLAQLRSQAIKVEGAIEEVVEAVRHFRYQKTKTPA